MRIEGWYPNEAQIIKIIEDEAMNRLEQAGHLVAEEARSLVPVRTGTLKATIRVIRLKGDLNQNVRVYAGNRIVGGGGAFYAHMVEKGTRKTPAHPFLRPALNNSKAGIMGIMESESGSDNTRSYKPGRG